MRRHDIREGMIVRSADGEKLGRVIACGEEAFQIEKGLFFPEDFVARYESIVDIRDGEVFLLEGRDALLAPGAKREKRELREQGLGARTMGAAEGDVRIPLVEEELDVTKRERLAGEVKIHKRIEQEQKTITVPVMKETVEVERVPVGTEVPAAQLDTAFQGETISVPVREEEVEIRKRPVVREEIRIRKDRSQEERRVAETVRREEAEVDTDRDEKYAPVTSPDIDPPKRW